MTFWDYTAEFRWTEDEGRKDNSSFQARTRTSLSRGNSLITQVIQKCREFHNFFLFLFYVYSDGSPFFGWHINKLKRNQIFMRWFRWSWSAAIDSSIWHVFIYMDFDGMIDVTDLRLFNVWGWTDSFRITVMMEWRFDRILYINI